MYTLKGLIDREIKLTIKADGVYHLTANGVTTEDVLGAMSTILAYLVEYTPLTAEEVVTNLYIRSKEDGN